MGTPRAFPSIDPVSALIGAGSSVVSSLIGADASSANQKAANEANLQATRETNETNLNIAQMSNDYNERMFDKQIQYNWDMWHKDNEYNSASAQRKRLEAAGLNPNLMMDGGSAGVAQSTGGVNPPSAVTPTMQAPHFESNADNIMRAYLSLGEAAQSAALNAAQISKLNSETEYQNLETSYASQSMAARYANLLASTDETKSRTSYNDYLRDLGRATFSSDVRRAELQNESLSSQIVYNQAQTNYMQLEGSKLMKELSWMDAEKKANLALLQAQVSELISRGKLNRSQAENLIKQGLLADAHTSKVRAETAVINKTTKAVVNKAYADAYRLHAENQNLAKFGTPYYNHVGSFEYSMPSFGGILGNGKIHVSNQFKK